MAYCDVYIGELCDIKFSWDGGDWNHNIPRPISPFFPPIEGQDDLPYRIIIDRIKSGALDGKQTDSASWVARISKKDLTTLVARLYSAAPESRLREVKHLYSHIEELDDNKKYALVATTGIEK